MWFHRAAVRRRTPGRAFPLLLVAVSLATGAVASAADSAATQRRTPLQLGLDFYRNRVVTFIITQSPGGSDDVFSRILIPYLADYLHATVQPENVSAAEGIGGADELAAASPTGLTIGEFSPFNVLTASLTNTPGYNFNPLRLAWLGQRGASANVLIANASSPFADFSAFRRESRSAKVLTLAPPSTANTDVRLFMAALGLRPQFVGAYHSNGQMEQGFVRGDGPVTYNSLADLGTFLEQGVAHVLAYSVLPPVGTRDRQFLIGKPSFVALAQEYRAQGATARRLLPAITDILTGGGVAVFTQTGVSGDKVTALRAAVAYAFHRQTFRTALLAAGDNPTYIDGASGKATYIAESKSGRPLVCYILGSC